MGKRARRLARDALVVLLALLAPAVGWCQSDALKERLLREAPKAWDAYRQQARRLQGSITKTMTLGVPRPEVTRMSVEFKQSPSSALFLLQYHLPDSGGLPGAKYPEHATVEATNESYSFTLRRTAERRPWTVASVNTSSEHRQKSTARKDLNEWIDNPLALGWAFEGPPPTVGDPSLEIKTVSAMTKEGRELVKMEFAYRPLSSTDGTTLFEGWAALDPANLWVAREVQARVSFAQTPDSKRSPRSIAETYEYEEGPENFPVLKSIVSKVKIENSGQDVELRYDCKLHLADVPETDFTLTAFGFSEPLGVKRGFPWYVPVGIAGVALIVAAVLLRVWLRRRKPT